MTKMTDPSHKDEMTPKQKANFSLSKSIFLKMLDWKSLPRITVSMDVINQMISHLNDVVSQPDESQATLLANSLKKLVSALDENFKNI